MKAAELKINGEITGLDEVWVHFKSIESRSSSQFSLLVRGEYIIDVFNEKRGKSKDVSWEEYILQNFREFGTLAFDSCLRKLRQIDQCDEVKPLWVVTSVQTVRIVSDGVLIEGTAEPRQISTFPEIKSIK